MHCKIDKRQIEKAIKEQRSVNRRIFLADTECKGLRLAINARSASWTYAFRKRGLGTGGKRHPMRTLKLGDLFSMTVQEARFEAEKIKAQIREGRDPADEKRAEISREQEKISRNQSLEWWVGEYQAQELGSDSKYKLTEISHIRLALSELNIRSLNPRDLTLGHIRELLMVHSSRPATSRQRLGALSRFLDFLQNDEIIEANPAKLIARRFKPKPAAPKQRFYDLAEIESLWYPASVIKEVYLNYLRFMISTPLRATEAAELRISQVNFQRKEILLSAKQTKNAQAFTMPATDLSLNIINKSSSLKKSGRVFSLSSKYDSKMKSWSHFNKVIRNASGVLDFNLHDLRRSFSTIIAENTDYSEAIIDSLLNHSQSSARQGVIAHYQLAKYVKRRREVMGWWADYIKTNIMDL